MTIQFRAQQPRQFVFLRGKGQVTIPTDVRKELGWEEGDRLEIVKTEYGIVLRSRPSSLMQLAGSLSEYARPEHWNMEGQELIALENLAVEEAVIEDVMDELGR